MMLHGPDESRVRFLCSDDAGLWEEGQEAVHVGRESNHPDAPNIHLFRLEGQLISLWNPFDRLIVERVRPGAPPAL